jgi:hypothetical protein
MGTPPPPAYVKYPGLSSQQAEMLDLLGGRWESAKKIKTELAHLNRQQRPMHEALNFLAKTAGLKTEFPAKNLNDKQFSDQETQITTEYDQQFGDLLDKALARSMNVEKPMPAREID